MLEIWVTLVRLSDSSQVWLELTHLFDKHQIYELSQVLTRVDSSPLSSIPSLESWHPYLLSAILPQYEHPETSREEEENRHEDVEGGKGHLSRAEVTVVVLLLHLDVERNPDGWEGIQVKKKNR